MIDFTRIRILIFLDETIHKQFCATLIIDVYSMFSHFAKMEIQSTTYI